MEKIIVKYKKNIEFFEKNINLRVQMCLQIGQKMDLFFEHIASRKEVLEFLRAKKGASNNLTTRFESYFASTGQCACKIFSMCLIKCLQFLQRTKWEAPFVLAKCLQNDVLRAYLVICKHFGACKTPFLLCIWLL